MSYHGMPKYPVFHGNLPFIRESPGNFGPGFNEIEASLVKFNNLTRLHEDLLSGRVGSWAQNGIFEQKL